MMSIAAEPVFLHTIFWFFWEDNLAQSVKRQSVDACLYEVHRES